MEVSFCRLSLFLSAAAGWPIEEERGGEWDDYVKVLSSYGIFPPISLSSDQGHSS
jgi:hypothetical protein